MARVNKSQYAILGCLALRAMSAYEIKQFIQRSVANFWAEGEGQLYPSLNQLTEKKFVSYEELPAKKNGIKKVYSISPQGRAALAAWLKIPAERSTYRNELLLKIFFGSLQDEKNNIELLENALGEASEALKDLELLKTILSEKEIAKNRKRYALITLDYGMEVLSAEIRWCRRWIKKLSEEALL